MVTYPYERDVKHETINQPILWWSNFALLRFRHSLALLWSEVFGFFFCFFFFCFFFLFSFFFFFFLFFFFFVFVLRFFFICFVFWVFFLCFLFVLFFGSYAVFIIFFRIFLGLPTFSDFGSKLRIYRKIYANRNIARPFLWNFTALYNSGEFRVTLS
jgi:hypothetical protein